jgi:hypothetical protein
MVELATAASVFFIIYIVARRVPAVFYALIVAYFLRFGAAVVNLYVVRLPDGDEDAIAFERTGWDLAQLPTELFWSSFSHTSANESYGWLVALPYRFVGRIEFVPQMMNVLLGTLIVYFVFRAMQTAWNQRIAVHGAWVVSCFPQYIHYSAVLLREVWIHFLLAVSIYYFLQYVYRGHQPKNAILSIVFSGLSALFHGGMFVAVLGLLAYFAWRGVRILFWERHFSFWEFITIGTLVFLLFPLMVQFSITELRLSSIGATQQLIDPEQFEEQATYAAQVRMSGGAAYPGFLAVRSGPELVLTLIPRVFYLLFSPFPWDVEEVFHAVGFIDGLFYILLFYTICKRWADLKRSHLLAMLWVLVPLVITFSIGTSNFGTGIRHRAKLFFVLLVFSGGISGFMRRMRKKVSLHHPREKRPVSST